MRRSASKDSSTGWEIETTGIEVIDESERTAKPSDLFWPWFAANVSLFGISYAGFALAFGINFWQAVVVAVVGISISFLLCGLIAVGGKRGSAPTMVLSRAAFGVRGQRVPGVVSWLASIGWETFLAIMATLATATVFRELGFGGGTVTKVVACVVVATMIVLASVAGYHIIVKLQSILTWITGFGTLVYIALTVHHVKWDAVTSIPAGSTEAVVGALVMMMTGFGLGWINISADWSRYQRRDSSTGQIVLWNTLGGAASPLILVTYGLLLAASDETLSERIQGDPVGTLSTLLPTWFLVPFAVVAVLGLVSGAVLGIYSSGLTLLSLGVRIPRPTAALLDGLLLTTGTIWVVFFATSFLGPFQSFLITLGVPLAAWAGIMIADIFGRKQPYDEDALFDPAGRYGAWNWRSVGTLVGASVVGWGLVINSFDDASFNNWQGYLLGPLGLGGRDGTWAYANLGVFAALVLGFVLTWVTGRGTIRRQESGTHA